MKKIIFLLVIRCIFLNCMNAQSVGINNTTPDASAILDVKSTSKGLLIPRMNTSGISSITNPAKGLLVLDTSKNQLMVNMGTTASPNWQTIVFSSGWNLTGNSNTNTGTHFIGTTDAKPLQFRVNNMPAGAIDHSSGNTSYGLDALPSNTSGTGNTAIGNGALFHSSLASNNTATGFLALFSDSLGAYNTASGYLALGLNKTGNYNIAIGYLAGSCNGFTDLDNSVVIGSGTCAQNSNYSILSTPTTEWNGGHQAWSTYSDARIKRNIKEDVAGLSFIMKLRPVTYNKNLSDETKVTGNEMKDYPSKYNVEKIRYTGFIAQDVEKAAGEINYDFSGLTKPKTSTDLYSLSYESFVVPLVKGMQEQQLIIQQQQQKINDLEKRLSALEKMISK